MLLPTWMRNRLGRITDAQWRQVAVGVILVMALIPIARVIAKPQGDFHLHRRFGGRLVAGEYIYAVNGLDLPYLPFWAVAHAPLSFLPEHAAQICILPIFALAAYGLFWILSRVSASAWPVDERFVFWGTVITIALASRFLVRDILECGVNLALVALAWGAVWFWRRRREWTGGCLLAVAIALKLTPALFLAWFAWKRQWKIAATTSLVLAMLLLSPLLFMDWPVFVDVHRVWWHHASRGLLAENPVQGVLGEESIQNVSLRPALGRFLVHLPEGHNASFQHPWSISFLNLSPAAAGWVVRILTGGLVLAVAWRFRRRENSRADVSLLWEAAGISVLMLLLSPLTWGQHCVGVIPAVYILVRECFHRGKLSKETLAVLVAYSAMILLFNRGIVGKQFTYLLDSYYTTTWCLLGVLWLVIRSHAQAGKCSEDAITLQLPRRDAALSKAA